MWNKLTTAAIAVLLATIVGLAAYSNHQASQIDALQAENQAQAKTITEQHNANMELLDALQQERETLAKQTALERELREKADDDVKIIYRTIEKDNCANQPLPSDVIKRLQ